MQVTTQFKEKGKQITGFDCKGIHEFTSGKTLRRISQSWGIFHQWKKKIVNWESFYFFMLNLNILNLRG